MKKIFFLLSLILMSCSKDSENTPLGPDTSPTPKFKLSIEAGKGGSVNTTGGEYAQNTSVTVSAIPDQGYIFEAWSDGSTDNPRTIIITSDLQLTALFGIQTFDFDYSGLGDPLQQFHPEGLGFIELNNIEFVLIPFCELQGEGLDYLRAFEINYDNSTIIDRTNDIFDVLPQVGFTKGPMLIEDFNSDGYQDFFLVDHGQENEIVDNKFKGAILQFYYGSASGFIKQSFPGITDLNLFYHHADMGDFDRDGDIDILSQRWSSYDHDVPNGNTMSILINQDGRFSISTLENPYTSVGSVLLTNVDDDEDLEALAGTYSYNSGELWYWDIVESTVVPLINNMGPYPMHDIIEVKSEANSRIFLFSELDESPVLSSTDGGKSVFESEELFDYQGRDIIVADFNLDGYDDFYMFYGDDGDGEWGTSFGTFKESMFLNNGSNEFSNPSSIEDQYGRELGNEINIFFYPLKKGDEGYKFIKFEQDNALQPPKGGEIVYLTFN